MTATCPAHPASAYGRPLIKVARELDRHLATMHRWRESGILDTDGIRHHLFMTRVGGRWYVRDEDLSAFFALLAGGGPTQAMPQGGQSARSRSAERASRELDHIGI